MLSCYEELQGLTGPERSNCSIAGMRIELLAMLQEPTIERDHECIPVSYVSTLSPPFLFVLLIC